MPDPAVAQALQRLSRNGVLLAEDVVEAARDPASVLHDHFEWDDTAAAHQHRLQQARRLISVTLVITEDNTPPAQLFVSLRTDRVKPGGGYRRTVDVLTDAAMRAQLMQEALADIRAFRAKYARLTELAGVLDAMAQVTAPKVQPKRKQPKAG